MTKVGKVIELKTNTSPPERSQCGLCSFKHDIYIYGGLGKGSTYLDDLWHINGIHNIYINIHE